MTGLEIWLLAVGLAMDCFAVSIASGIILKRARLRPMLVGGVSFAVLGIKQFSAILSPIGIIGFVSFALSMVGLMFGIRFGCGIARRLRAELWGGIILVIIGTKILVEHLFF